MIEEGTILQKRYRVDKQIGQGGMGSVYVATDERFGSTVAVKETLFADEHFEKAFKREARLLNSLKHSALPKVSDHFIENNSQYIVMEYIGGDDLFEKIEKANEAFPVEDVLTWANQLLDALEYLHGQENPVIHRDIKPQNLKLTSHGQIILLDFGLAKGNPTDANHQTAANSIFGYSRNYASLEQIQGTGTDPRSDLYSLAATIYHLVTGNPPADALTRVMLVLNEETDPLRPAIEEHKQVPQNLSNALLVAMSLNANQRPQSASEMRKMLSDENYTGPIPSRETMADSPAETNFFSSKTQVMSSEGSQPPVSKAEMKTEVLPAVTADGKSIQTKIAKQPTAAGQFTTNVSGDRIDPGVITRSFSSRKNMITASVGGLLFLVVSAAGGAYLLGPELFGSDEPAIDNVKSDNAANKSVTAPFADNINANVVNGDTGSEMTETHVAPVGQSDSGADRKPAKEVVEKKAPTPKAEKKSIRHAPKKPKVVITTMGDDGKVIISNGEIETRDAKVNKDKIETRELLLDSNGVRIKKRQPLRRPTITKKQFKRLSPEQKRNVRRALESWRRAENARRKAEGRPPLPKRNPGT